MREKWMGERECVCERDGKKSTFILLRSETEIPFIFLSVVKFAACIRLRTRPASKVRGTSALPMPPMSDGDVSYNETILVMNGKKDRKPFRVLICQEEVQSVS